jgi:hypothetical protein
MARSSRRLSTVLSGELGHRLDGLFVVWQPDLKLHPGEINYEFEFHFRFLSRRFLTSLFGEEALNLGRLAS